MIWPLLGGQFQAVGRCRMTLSQLQNRRQLCLVVATGRRLWGAVSNADFPACLPSPLSAFHHFIGG